MNPVVELFNRFVDDPLVKEGEAELGLQTGYNSVVLAITDGKYGGNESEEAFFVKVEHIVEEEDGKELIEVRVRQLDEEPDAPDLAEAYTLAKVLQEALQHKLTLEQWDLLWILGKLHKINDTAGCYCPEEEE